MAISTFDRTRLTSWPIFPWAQKHFAFVIKICKQNSTKYRVVLHEIEIKFETYSLTLKLRYMFLMAYQYDND